jgi:hypothetical protein
MYVQMDKKPMHRKNKKLKLDEGQAYERSRD